MDGFVVSPAATHEWLPACRLLFADNTAADVRERLLAAVEPTALFVARAANRLWAAALVQVLPGALGLAWPPRGESDAAKDAVITAACDWLRAQGVKVCQAFAHRHELDDVARLARAGFRPTTQLVLMSCRLSSSPAPTGSPKLSLERYSLSAASRLAAFRPTLLATQQGTLDCPELNTTRTTDELLAGFEAATSSECYLASCAGAYVGLLLFEPCAESRQAEISYLGVVPTARGHGIGSAILTFAQNELYATGCQTITLSVDVRNQPAMTLYARHGFVEVEDGRREVWLAHWANEPTEK